MIVNKTNLNNIIRWSQSKLCEYKKQDIVNKILQLKNNDSFIASTDSWGWKYTFSREDDYLFIDDGDGVDILILKYKV